MKFIFLLSGILFSIIGTAQTLRPGAPAPAIRAGEWVKGNPVNEFEKGKIYVVEFWATWCGPCKKSIPHISQLAQKYSNDITVIGVSVMEANTDNVKPFVEKMGDQMNYTVAIDQQESSTAGKGFMTDNWLKPAGITGIPSAIIVGKTGLVEWIGHPMNMEEALEQVVKGTWNIQAYAKKEDNKNLVENMSKQLSENPDWNALEQEVKTKYPEFTADSIVLLLQSAYFGRKKDIPAFTNAYTTYFDKYDPKSNAENINEAAWKVFSYSNNKQEMNKAAKWMQIALKNNPNNPYYLDTYANLLYKAGNNKKALKEEKKALVLVNDMLAAELATTYYKMKTGQPTWKFPVVKPVYVNNAKAWEEIRKSLSKFSEYQGDSITTAAAIGYTKGKDSIAYVQHILYFADKFGSLRNAVALNADAWEIFSYSMNNEELNKALQWSAESLKDEKFANARHYFYDTYANLLYKLNRKEEAIAMEQKAIEHSPEKEKAELQKTLKKMENNERTW